MDPSNDRARWRWLTGGLVLVGLAAISALVSYGSLKSDVSHTANEVNAIQRALELKADLQLVAQGQQSILAQLQEINLRLGRLEGRSK